MADNSPSPRAQPEDECYYRHHIRGNVSLFPTYQFQKRSLSLQLEVDYYYI